MKCSSMMAVSTMLLVLTFLSMTTLSSQQVPSAPTSLGLTSSASEITIEWSQPSSSAAVDNYTLFYRYVFRSCDGDIGGHMTVSGLPGTTRSYSLSQPEEFADYMIHLTASNQAGNSAITMDDITTQKADPSSGVQNFSVISVSPTSINITWDNVECRHRNSMINRFILFVNLVSTGRRVRGVKIEEINARNHYFIDNLLPRTNYSIFLRPDDDDPFLGRIFQGVPVTLYEVTAVPETVGFLYNGRIYSNNSAVEISSSNSLLCLTDLVQCCSSAETGSDPIGSWTLPSGFDPPTSGTGIIMSPGPSTVSLTSTTTISPPPSGVYSCKIIDASNIVRVLYLNVFSSGQMPMASSCLQAAILVSISPTGFEHNLTCTIWTCPNLASIANLTLISVDWTEQGIQILNENISKPTMVGRNKFLSVISVSNIKPDVNYTCRATLPYVLRGSNSQKTLEAEAFFIPATSLYIYFRSNMSLESNLSRTQQFEIMQVITNILSNCSEYSKTNLIDAEFQQTAASITFNAVITSSSNISSVKRKECLLDMLPNQISVSFLSLQVVCISPCTNSSEDSARDSTTTGDSSARDSVGTILNTSPQILITLQLPLSSDMPHISSNMNSTANIPGSDEELTIAEIIITTIIAVIIIIVIAIALVAAFIFVIINYRFIF